MTTAKLLEEAIASRDWYMANGSKDTGGLLSRLIQAIEAQQREADELALKLRKEAYRASQW